VNEEGIEGNSVCRVTPLNLKIKFPLNKSSLSSLELSSKTFIGLADLSFLLLFLKGRESGSGQSAALCPSYLQLKHV